MIALIIKVQGLRHVALGGRHRCNRQFDLGLIQIEAGNDALVKPRLNDVETFTAQLFSLLRDFQPGIQVPQQHVCAGDIGHKTEDNAAHDCFG